MPGIKESFWIDKLSTEFENESYLVRKACAEREMEEARIDRWPSPIADERVYDSAEELSSNDNNDSQNQNNSDDNNRTEDEDNAVDVSALSGSSVPPGDGVAAIEVKQRHPCECNDVVMMVSFTRTSI